MKRSLLVLLLAAKSLFAQDFGEQVSVSYVMVPFSVLGAKGVPITDLAAKEVTLLVDGKKVATDLFERSIIETEGVDPYEAASRVKELLSHIETSYALTARIQQLSLLRFLG